MVNSKAPVFLFVFANELNDHLPHLLNEYKSILSLLSPLHDNGTIQYEFLIKPSIDELYRQLGRFHNRLAVFHFSGHSDDQFLRLNQTDLFATYFAPLLGMQKNLKLVFLNGCSNQNQVEDFFKEGVKSIISTSAAIADDKACKFSESFYHSLISGKSTQESFFTAKSLTQQSHSDIEIHFREINQSQIEVDKDQFEWGLYYRDNVLTEWKLNLNQSLIEESDFTTEEEITEDEENHFLFEIAKGLIENKISDYSSIQKSVDSNNINKVRDYILDILPTALSIQIRDLFQKDACVKGRLRIKELAEVYITLMKFITSILLSDLWKSVFIPNSLELRQDFKIRESHKEVLYEYINLDFTKSFQYNYIYLLEVIWKIFRLNNITPFIKKLEDLGNEYFEFEELYDSFQYLESELKQPYYDQRISKEAVGSICEQGDLKLAQVIRKCCFLFSYQVVAVKDIKVNMPLKSLQPDYVHSGSILNGHQYDHRSEESVSKKSFTNNNSVIITDDIYESTHQLNLSPFIINLNAYKKKYDRIPKVYFFNGLDQQGCLYYELAETLNENFKLEMEPERKIYKKELMRLRDQLNWFQEDLRLSKS